MPKVSVIIPTYNRSHFILDAIDSVLNQAFQDFEIIVIDDGSNDDTREVLRKYDAIVNHVYQENKGRSEARNTGIKIAKGEYIAFLDDDDIWLPQKLEKQITFLDANPDIGLVHAFTEVIDEEGRMLTADTKNRLKLYRKAVKVGYTYEGMSHLCVMFMSTVMLRKECLDKVGLFDPNIPAFEDWDFYLRFALKYSIVMIPEFLVRFRMHKGRTTTDEFAEGRIKTAMKHLTLLNSCIGIPFRSKIQYNFYVHLANTYYFNRHWLMQRTYTLKAFKFNPLVLFRYRLGLHFLVSLMSVKKVKALSYAERIIPQETYGGPLAIHLKRYDFAKQLCEDKVVLDSACGVGYGSRYLAEIAKKVMGVDISEEAITYAKGHYQKENIQFMAMDVHNLSFPDKYFDIVCSFETLEHLKDPARYIAEVKRVLNDNGIFIVSTPRVKRTIYKPKNPHHKVEFSTEYFQGLLEKYFSKVEIFGQRRLQSTFHYYLQKIDVFHLRAWLPAFARRKICHTLATHSWDEAGLRDFIINKERIKEATDLIGVCYK